MGAFYNTVLLVLVLFSVLQPFRPFEQLMAVFPAGSKQHIPPTWQPLMYEPDSPIIDFYPTSFRIDLNGKKFAWMGKLKLKVEQESPGF